MEVKYLSIIEKFKTDAKAGLSALFEAYGRHLFQFTVTKWSLDEDEAYDVLYKTLETVCKVIDRYEFSSETHFQNWLLKIHKNNILQFIRAKKSKEQIVLNYNDWITEVAGFEEDAFDVGDYEPIIQKLNQINPYEEVPLNSQLFLALQKALLIVSDMERELLLLKMNNYSYEEIARMLGIENKQLKVKFIRAKAKVEKKTLEILKEINHEATRNNTTV
ncbi:RNA polymerase sigma factor [Pedobacter nyackensis]|uniref:RNA polymerase sigma-70 factor, ECF subfamily n=1 Tax=Pedobacter nyackensis TaxID=475255 RepID=A0A1W2A0K5_9SPHI|nr:sigma-70 family RNA polymerase sigma factor [Pedobacter nyackensis]SMC53992.1 RNA polymerase sigma-70 factor, ECF subfamily [Pedobacter nyackensis]